MSSNIEFSCTRCGSKQFQIPTNPKPDDMVVCSGCGGQAKYGVIMDSASNQAKDSVSKMFREAYKGL